MNDTLYNAIATSNTEMNELYLQIGHDSVIDPQFMSLVYGETVYYVIALAILIALPILSFVKGRKQLS
ncbi:MAG: hypothetical protein AB7U79_03655 [Candidatus Izemoplasmatales bacterium]